MTLYELLSQKVPFHNIDPATKRSREVVNKRRPLLAAKETRSLVLFQKLMQMCWSHNAEERPRMEQVHEWASSDEFERLRAEINLTGVASISCACVIRITPGNEKESSTDIRFKPTDSSCHSSDSTEHAGKCDDNGLVTGQSGSFLALASEDSHHIEQRESDSSTKGELRFQPWTFADPNASGDAAKQQFQPYTQIWVCSRGYGLLQIFTYFDGHPGVYVRCVMMAIVYKSVRIHLWKSRVEHTLLHHVF